MNILLSIIYVYYNTPDEIKKSIETLKLSLGKIPYEVIIVENASPRRIPEELSGLSRIKIIKNSVNYGYGKGLNQGAKIAQGKYLLLVNPDVEFARNSIDKLLEKAEKDSKTGVIGPQLIGEKGEILQSISGVPFLFQSVFVFSFIARIWPTNSFLVRYHNLALDRDEDHEVDVVSGACMLVRKSCFDEIDGFDERFFMYFEEADFCLRIKKSGYKILYASKAKVIHLIGKSNQNKEWIRKTFEQSRFKFFKKYHGLFPAVLGEFLLRFLNLGSLLLLVILSLSAFLNLYQIDERMIFIGDQAWFYLSARDMLSNGQIPLVGIASSHPWLHQGPLWTYLLALILWIFNYNPLSGGYFTALLSVVTVFIVYKLGENLLSKRAGLISAFLYSTSPLIVAASQMPYHTSLIPLFTLLFVFSSYKFVKRNSTFFPLSILFLSILYNLELATVVLWFILFIILIYGVWKKTEWINKILNKKILIYSILAFLIPMLPILIYDFSHNFPQTLKFAAWIGYKILSFLGVINLHKESLSVTSSAIFAFSFNFYQNLVFAKSGIAAFIILIFSFGVLFVNTYSLLRKKTNDVGFTFLTLWIAIPLAGYLINNTPSGAYLPIFFPAFIYLLSFLFEKLVEVRVLVIPAILLIALIVFMNIHFVVLSKNFINRLNLSKKLAIAREIVKEADGRPYNIIGIGDGSQFESFTMSYEYLAWWLGHSPVKSPQKLRYVIQEDKSGVYLMRNE